ncbi:hypothetical protein Pint_16874 [Pistacia integerrima]|uniref:Uncharacterized protein n=1 Tax=Pistacia integerrima TaxID=434235 RepID=A0ACC0ZES0_9ROSI|nr:hypothetical protein Pint_16874 [Pistacia integerrima]
MAVLCRRNMAYLYLVLSFLLCSGFGFAELEKFEQSINGDGSLSFLVIGDWGRRGEFNQSEVALQMGSVGEKLGINFVVSTGDNFYDDGLSGEDDPAFEESFSKIYTAQSLQKQWYSGNFPLHYPYLITKLAEIFFIDTTPFVKMYFTNEEGHTYDWRGVKSRKPYTANLLKDLEVALRESSAKWKIVIGHHAIRSIGHHGDTEELINRVLPLLKTYNVDFYMNGHDHCLEHFSDKESPIQFLTSGAGSKAWRGDVKEKNRDGLQFFYDGQGFMSVELNRSEAKIVFYDVFGEVLHKWSTKKELHSSI